jgi:hypothetical protein
MESQGYVLASGTITRVPIDEHPHHSWIFIFQSPKPSRESRFNADLFQNILEFSALCEKIVLNVDWIVKLQDRNLGGHDYLDGEQKAWMSCLLNDSCWVSDTVSYVVSEVEVLRRLARPLIDDDLWPSDFYCSGRLHLPDDSMLSPVIHDDDSLLGSECPELMSGAT